MKWPANRISRTSHKSFGMYDKAAPLMRQGHDLIHLEVGRPNFDTPLHIKEATKKSLDEGKMLNEDDRRRRMICQRLNEIDGIDCPLPQGTIYAFPDVSAFGKPVEQLADEILAKTNVVVETGAFYGAVGRDHLRLCFGAEPYERIDEAMNRLQDYFKG